MDLSNIDSFGFTKRQETIVYRFNDVMGKSPSHGLSHSLRAIRHGRKLCEEYGGDQEIIDTSLLLHDLSREYGFEGDEHTRKSFSMALDDCWLDEYSPKDIELIELCIILHEDYNLKSKDVPVEVKIVNDADRLDGFGALGVYRVIAHTVEMKEDISSVKLMLSVSMPARIENLNFEYSRELANYSLAEAFLESLKITEDLKDPEGAMLIYNTIAESVKKGYDVFETLDILSEACVSEPLHAGSNEIVDLFVTDLKNQIKI